MSDAIMIVGAGGFIGTALTTSLVSAGESVIAGVRSAVGNLPRGASPIVMNYQDPAKIQELLKECGSVIYMAADSTPVSTAGRPRAEMDFNLRPLLTLLEVLSNFQHIPLVYLSSAGSLYPDSEGRLLDEGQLPSPRSYHGAGKIAAEHFIGAWCHQNKMRATIIRPSNVFGPGQLQQKGFGVIPTAFDATLRNEPISLRGDGQAARDYLYIDDLINLCTAVLRKCPVTGVEIYNAGTGTATSLNQLLALVENVTGRKLERRHKQTEIVDAETVAVDPSRAARVFAWKAQMPLQEGLEIAWKWYRARYFR